MESEKIMEIVLNNGMRLKPVFIGVGGRRAWIDSESHYYWIDFQNEKCVMMEEDSVRFVRCNIPCYKPWISGCRRNISLDIDDIVDCGYYGI